MYGSLTNVREKSKKDQVVLNKQHQEVLGTLLHLACPDLFFALMLLVMNEFYVIYQQRNVRIVSFGSRTLVGAEANYHSSKFLAQKWAV